MKLSLPPTFGPRRIGSTACATLLLMASTQSWAADYTFVKIGNPAQTGSSALALDNHGRVATTSLIRSFLFADNSHTAHLEVTYANIATSTPGIVAQGLNDLGEVVGRFRTNGAPANQTRGFLRRADGTFEPFDVPGVASTSISEINNRSSWVGETRSDLTSFGLIRGFVHSNGLSTEIHFPGAVLSRAYGINDAGDIVGQYQLEDAVSRPFLLRKGFYTQLVPANPPGGFVSGIAFSISDNGLVLGTYRDLANVSKTWVMRADGTFEYPALPGTGRTINNAGQIAGSFVDSSNANTPTPYLATRMPSAVTANILALPTVPGGTYNVAKDISDDGHAIAGFSTSTASGEGLEAIRWQVMEGISGLGDLPPNNTANFEFFSYAWKTTGNGSTVVGHGTGTNGASLAFKWTHGAGLISLGDLAGGEVFSQAKGVSDDGSIIVGYSTSALGDEPFRWTAAGGMQSLGTLPGGTNSGVAWDISADGAVIVGQAQNTNGFTEAFRWTAATGLVGLGDLPGGAFSSRALAVSRNGRWIVGRSESANGKEAFVWSSETGMRGLGDLPGGVMADRFDGDAFSVSDDGVVVGSSETVVNSEFGHAAFIWDATRGIRDLKTVLASDFGVNMRGWTLESAEGISANGRFLAGSGTDPAGNLVAWRVTLPEDRKPAGFHVTYLALSDSAGDTANKINNLGEITGTMDGPDGVSRGYRFSTVSGLEVARAGYPGSGFTEWGGLNSAGTLAGYFADPADPTFNTYRAFVRSANGTETILTWSGDPDFGFTVDINERGQVAGGGGTTAWVWNPDGTFNAFKVPGFTVNGAFGMNDHGVVVGAAWPGFFDTPNGLIYHTASNTATIWNYPGAAQTTLYGINNRGDIVGEFKPNLTSANIPFVRWADGSTQVLEFVGLTGVRVYDINDHRLLVGRYKDGANKNRSFYATPSHVAGTRSYTLGHGDIRPMYTNGVLRLIYNLSYGAEVDGVEVGTFEDRERGVDFEPEALRVVVPQASLERPDGPAWDFLGTAAGQPVWFVPEVQEDDRPWLGLSTESLTEKDWADGLVQFQLTGFSGPPGGHFALFQNDGDTNRVHFQTADGVDEVDVYRTLGLSGPGFPAHIHAHANWGFTRPGIYRLEFRLSGRHVVDGPKEAQAAFLIEVARPAPVLQFARTEAGGLSLSWATELGATYRVQRRSRLDSGTWSEWLVREGTGLSQQVQVSTQGDGQFYRIVIE